MLIFLNFIIWNINVINVYVQLLNLPVGFIFTFTSFRVVGKYVHHPLVQIGRWKNMKYQEKKPKSTGKYSLYPKINDVFDF